MESWFILMNPKTSNIRFVVIIRYWLLLKSIHKKFHTA